MEWGTAFAASTWLVSTVSFTADYWEDVALNDGTAVRLRPIRPDDKPRLREILARLSPRSRVMRFFTARSHLSDAELRYLTEVDGTDHLAILAMRGDESIGVARFIRGERGGRIAEPAFAVIDDFQGRGLGRILVARLAAAAHERGIDSFEAEVLRGNQTMLRLLHELDGAVLPRESTSPDSITVAIDLPARAAVR